MCTVTLWTGSVSHLPIGPARQPVRIPGNADEICQRTVGYFRNLRIQLDVASWRIADDVLARERALAPVDDADYVFFTPGSPTYALRL